MTPNPTPSQVLANLPKYGGRITAAWNEILSILEELLPTTIARANATCCDSRGNPLQEPGSSGLPHKFSGFYVDGEIQPATFPCITIAADVQSEESADGISDTGKCVLHLQTALWQTRRDVDIAADVLCLMRGVLWHYQGTHTDGQGRVLWNSLQFTGISLGPQDDKNKSGLALHFQIEQTPSEELWKPGSGEPIAAPTPDEVLDSLRLSGGRLSLLWNETLIRLEACLPAALESVEAEFGLRFPTPEGYHVLGEVLPPKFPMLVVGATAKTHMLTFRYYGDEVSMDIYCLWPRAEQRRQIDGPADYVMIVRAIMEHFHQGVINESGLRVWTELHPTGMSFNGNENFKDFGGFIAHFSVLQGPGEEQWRLPAP
jgi:hypothetical protein